MVINRTTWLARLTGFHGVTATRAHASRGQKVSSRHPGPVVPHVTGCVRHKPWVFQIFELSTAATAECVDPEKIVSYPITVSVRSRYEYTSDRHLIRRDHPVRGCSKTFGVSSWSNSWRSKFKRSEEARIFTFLREGLAKEDWILVVKWFNGQKWKLGRICQFLLRCASAIWLTLPPSKCERRPPS